MAKEVETVVVARVKALREADEMAAMTEEATDTVVAVRVEEAME